MAPDRVDATASMLPAPEPRLRPDPADFLWLVAGRGQTASGQPSHLRMSDRPDGPKYHTVHRHLTIQDCRAHLAGAITIGGHLQTCGVSWSICFDADDAAGYQLLERAAAQLHASGASPFLEQTWLPEEVEHAGGGKLWVFFAEPVRHAYALAAAEGHARELRDVRERFPGATPVRLPGGFYRRSVDMWSELCAYGAADDSWHGGEMAIQFVTEHLTPATWVHPPQRLERPGGRPSGPSRVAVPGARAHNQLPETICQGQGRNQWLTRIAGSDRRWGMSGHLILARLQHVNETLCDPPLDETEVRRIALGMERYTPADGKPVNQSRWRWDHGSRTD